MLSSQLALPAIAGGYPYRGTGESPGGYGRQKLSDYEIRKPSQLTHP
jgi:hypothetical protein